MDDGFRASDADRHRAVALLRDHFAAGRLTPAELDERLTMALRAVTLGGLRRALADLPGPAPALRHDGPLERGYRRLLAFYPARYRRVHEEEILAVLMTGAPEGKRRPGLAEAADLIVGALRVWCQPPRGGVAGWRGALALISAAAVLGLLAGVGFAAVNPPLPTKSVSVAIRLSGQAYSGPAYTDSQLIMERAALRVRPAVSLQALQSRALSSRAFGRIVVISAQATNAAQVRVVADVAASYADYVNGKSAPRGNGKAPAMLMYMTSVPLRMSRLPDLLNNGGLGALCGALIGATGAVALSRPRQRFRMT
jgi:hypothetical protein